MLLPRFTIDHIADERKVARIILESGSAPESATVARATLPGDNRRLRGIPAVARGVAGVSPGTDPYGETARRLTSVRRPR